MSLLLASLDLLALQTVAALRAPPWPDRRMMGRRTVLGAAVALPALPASAWCGEQYPSWAYFLKWDEIAVPFTANGAQGEVTCRIVGDFAREQKVGVPPVLLVGTPGLGYDYLENLETLTVSDRRVIEVTFAGTSGKTADGAALGTVDACATQLQAVCAALKLPKVHVVAHGLGAGPALRLMGGLGGAGRSLTLFSPYGALADLRPAARESAQGGASRKALLPTTTARAIDSCVADSASPSGPLLPALLASSEPLGGALLAAQLAPLAPPIMLVSGGEADIVDDGWTDLPASLRRRSYAEGGHLPFVDAAVRDRCLLDLLEFLDDVDGVATNRELKFADPIQTIKELNTPTTGKDCSRYKSQKAKDYCEAENAKALTQVVKPPQ